MAEHDARWASGPRPCLGTRVVLHTFPKQCLSAVLPTQLFPGRPPVRRLLEMLQEWLASLPLDRIPYNAVLDLVDNKMRVSPAPPGPLLLPRPLS